MSQVDNVIKELKSLDLSRVSDDEVVKTVTKLGKLLLLAVHIRKGHFIYRSRPDKVFTPYYWEDDITYIKDPEIIPQYNRASLKGQSMFYGCVTPEDEHFCQLQTIIEVSNIAKDETNDGEIHEEYITMGKFRVIKELSVTSVVHHAEYIRINQQLKTMNEIYSNIVEQFPDKKEDYINVVEYLSNEFSKQVAEDKRYEYKISAAFTKVNLAFGIHGILYPSIKVGGKGFNVAIPPEIADEYLKLEKLEVWRIFKKKKKMVETPYLHCDKFTSDAKFIWEQSKIYVPSKKIELELNKS